MDRRLFLRTATLTTLECLTTKFGKYRQESAAKSWPVISIQTLTTKGPLPHFWKSVWGRTGQ